MNNRKLSPKQTAFVTEYIKDFNGTQAAIRAGYSPKTANEQAAQLLAKLSIQEAVKAYQDKASAEAEISLKWWLKKMKQLADFDPRRFFDENGDFRPVGKLDDDCAAALAGFDIQEILIGSGDDKQLATVKRVKFIDRKGVLDLIGKHLGAYVNELSIIQKLSDEDVDNIVNKWLAKTE